jgi:shikimate kinase
MKDCPNLFLIGSRGAGKTVVGKLLADRLRWHFIDADNVLQARLGKTIQEIFKEAGEAVFRNEEKALLQEICRGSRQVVATGGGIVLCEENRHRMRSAGKVVWLTAEPEILWQRIKADSLSKTQRPDLTVGGLEEVRQVLQARMCLYRSCADHTFTTAGMTPDEVTENVFATLFAGLVTPTKTG